VTRSLKSAPGRIITTSVFAAAVGISSLSSIGYGQEKGQSLDVTQRYVTQFMLSHPVSSNHCRGGKVDTLFVTVGEHEDYLKHSIYNAADCDLTTRDNIFVSGLAAQTLDEIEGPIDENGDTYLRLTCLDACVFKHFFNDDSKPDSVPSHEVTIKFSATAEEQKSFGQAVLDLVALVKAANNPTNQYKQK
jgi:hypothetical protein